MLRLFSARLLFGWIKMTGGFGTRLGRRASLWPENLGSLIAAKNLGNGVRFAMIDLQWSELTDLEPL
jgi:hypothetical protein